MLPPSDEPALDEGFRTHLPRLFDIAVFCMSIYQWVFYTKLLKTKEWSDRVIKRLDVSVVHCLLVVPYISAQDSSSLRAAYLTRSDSMRDAWT